MTAAILDIGPNIRRVMIGDLSAHFLRQAGNLIIMGSRLSAGTQALALETIGGMVLQLAERVQAEFRKSGAAAVPVVMLPEEPSGGLPCDMEQV